MLIPTWVTLPCIVRRGEERENLKSNVYCMLVLLSPTKEGLQQHLDTLYRFCQTWTLTVNLSKTKIMMFQKRSSSQDHKYKFHLDSIALEHTKNNAQHGLNISATCNFHKVVNDLRDKARRAFYAIKRNIKFDIPIMSKKYSNQLQNPLPFMFVRAGVGLPNKNSQNGTNTKLRLCMQDSAKFCK